jgi:glutamate-5-semialdehyde dehydrogenase
VTNAAATETAAVELVAREAAEANAAVPHLDEAAVDAALRAAARSLAERRGEVLRANEADVDGAAGLDAGALDRLRLDDGRIDVIARGLEATAELPPIERDVRSWRLARAGTPSCSALAPLRCGR